MKHLYLFTLEITPLEVGRVYPDLPSHLTLMSRFWSLLPPDDLAAIVRSLFEETVPINLVFGETVELGPKRVMAHLVSSPAEQVLHHRLRSSLDTIQAKYQYPQFMSDNHKPHVTRRESARFDAGDHRLASAVYLIEVVDGQRIVHSKFELASINTL